MNHPPQNTVNPMTMQSPVDTFCSGSGQMASTFSLTDISGSGVSDLQSVDSRNEIEGHQPKVRPTVFQIKSVCKNSINPCLFLGKHSFRMNKTNDTTVTNCSGAERDNKQDREGTQDSKEGEYGDERDSDLIVDEVSHLFRMEDFNPIESSMLPTGNEIMPEEQIGCMERAESNKEPKHDKCSRPASRHIVKLLHREVEHEAYKSSGSLEPILNSSEFSLCQRKVPTLSGPKSIKSSNFLQLQRQSNSNKLSYEEKVCNLGLGLGKETRDTRGFIMSQSKKDNSLTHGSHSLILSNYVAQRSDSYSDSTSTPTDSGPLSSSIASAVTSPCSEMNASHPLSSELKNSSRDSGSSLFLANPLCLGQLSESPSRLRCPLPDRAYYNETNIPKLEARDENQQNYYSNLFGYVHAPIHRNRQNEEGVFFANDAVPKVESPVQMIEKSPPCSNGRNVHYFRQSISGKKINLDATYDYERNRLCAGRTLDITTEISPQGRAKCVDKLIVGPPISQRVVRQLGFPRCSQQTRMSTDRLPFCLMPACSSDALVSLHILLALHKTFEFAELLKVEIKLLTFFKKFTSLKGVLIASTL
ncbi:unnamed protein product [Protopolystoma xenopodis]|uniref:Uncharacterized protein n=1 Tax=Protopolystoma xenopodis TaxID=117903 RepID=A0A448WCI4_9PLAT|nr:unnamed protein product [Protopolystoma xenopodis]